MEDEIDEFDKTLIWSVEEEKLNAKRVSEMRIPSFYLIIAALFIFVTCFFILYYSNRRKKLGALDMMKDPDNVFEEFTEDGQDNEEVPLIELSEDEAEKPIEEPALSENMVEPKAQEVA